MSVRKTRRRLMIEALERRETPSVGLGGSVHELARHSRPRPIVLSGSGTVDHTSSTSGEVTVNARGLGTLTGPLSATSLTTFTADVSGGTTTLDLAINGSFSKGRVPHFHGTFTVEGGSLVNGASVTGSGRINGTPSGVTVLNFTINGQLHT